MKTLRKVSFENFERLTVVEASQLYGGTGDNPPTTPMPTDSIPVNKNDSIPSTPPIPKKKNELGVTVERGKDGVGKLSGTYKYNFNDNFSVSTKIWGDSKGKWGFEGTLNWKL